MAQSKTTTPANTNTPGTGDGEKKCCPKCGNTALKGGIKYQDICTTCEPVYLNRCSGCQRLLWDCMCIRPHTWE